jgi:hypothetical protein
MIFVMTVTSRRWRAIPWHTVIGMWSWGSPVSSHYAMGHELTSCLRWYACAVHPRPFCAAYTCWL